MRERESGIPPEQSLDTAKHIKEKYGYICPDVAKEFAKYDSQPEKWFKVYEGVNSITKKVRGHQIWTLIKGLILSLGGWDGSFLFMHENMTRIFRGVNWRCKLVISEHVISYKPIRICSFISLHAEVEIRQFDQTFQVITSSAWHGIRTCHMRIGCYSHGHGTCHASCIHEYGTYHMDLACHSH